MKHINLDPVYRIDVDCTDRGQHDTARLGAIVQMSDGSLMWRGLRRYRDRQALHRRGTSTHEVSRGRFRPPEIGWLRAKLAAGEQVPGNELGRPYWDWTLEMQCPVCRRNPQIGFERMEVIWPKLVAAGLERVDLSALESQAL